MKYQGNTVYYNISSTPNIYIYIYISVSIHLSISISIYILLGLRKNKQQPFVKRKQFPLISSWACTVHKVQGLSLAEGAVYFDLEKQTSFNQEQIYVVLSKISSMNKTYLIGSYNNAALKANKTAKRGVCEIKK